jgi:glycosyltransferase EpsH
LVTAWGKIYKTEIIKKNKIQFTDTKIIGTEDALFNIQYLEFADKVKF